MLENLVDVDFTWAKYNSMSQIPNRHKPNVKEAWAKYQIGMSQIPNRHEPNRYEGIAYKPSERSISRGSEIYAVVVPSGQNQRK